MNRIQRHIRDSLVRAQAFLDEHADRLGGLRETPARRQLDEAVAQLRSSAESQDGAGRSSAAHRERSKAVATEITQHYMGPIARFARQNLRGAPDFAALSRNVRNARPNPRLVTAARSMATAATPLADRFTEAQFPADLVPQLGALADQLETSLAQSAATKAGRVAATEGIARALTRGREAVAMLDPVVQRRLRETPLLAAWRMVKRVQRVGTGGGGTGVAASPTLTVQGAVAATADGQARTEPEVRAA